MLDCYAIHGDKLRIYNITKNYALLFSYYKEVRKSTSENRNYIFGHNL